MASILDSAKLVFTDSAAFGKLFVMSLCPYVVYKFIKGVFVLPVNYAILIIVVLSLVYLGFLVQILNNSIEEKPYIISSLNPFIQLWVGFKTVISCSTPILLSIFLVFWVLKASGLEGQEYNAALIILGSIGTSFSLTSLIFFGKRLRIIDGVNFIKIIKNFHEIIVYIALGLLMLIAYNLVTGLPLGAFVYMFFGERSNIYQLTICFIITFNLAIYFQNLSHAYFEQIRD